MMTKFYLTLFIFSTLFSHSLFALTKFEVEYTELSGPKKSKVQSSVVADNVMQLAHPDLETYLRVESTPNLDGTYNLQLYIKDLKSGEILAKPQVVARAGETAEIELRDQYRVSLKASEATPN